MDRFRAKISAAGENFHDFCLSEHNFPSGASKRQKLGGLPENFGGGARAPRAPPLDTPMDVTDTDAVAVVSFG